MSRDFHFYRSTQIRGHRQRFVGRFASLNLSQFNDVIYPLTGNQVIGREDDGDDESTTECNCANCRMIQSTSSPSSVVEDEPDYKETVNAEWISKEELSRRLKLLLAKAAKHSLDFDDILPGDSTVKYALKYRK